MTSRNWGTEDMKPGFVLDGRKDGAEPHLVTPCE